jgi:hypothetical protein
MIGDGDVPQTGKTNAVAASPAMAFKAVRRDTDLATLIGSMLIVELADKGKNAFT